MNDEGAAGVWRRWMVAGVAAVLTALCGFATAQAGIENRPLNSDEATVLDKGKVVVATGYAFLRQRTSDNEWDWVTDLEAGLPGHLEVDVEIPHRIIDYHDNRERSDVNGFGDVATWLEWGFMDERPMIPALSAAFSVKTQSGNKDKKLGTGETNYQVTALASKTFGSTSAHLNIGLTVVGHSPAGTSLRNTLNWNVALEHAWNARLMLMGELYGQTNQDRSAEVDPLDCLGGFVYSLNDHLAIDVGIGTGLSPASPDLRVTTGLTYTF